MHRFCLSVSGPAAVEERLLDVLLDAAGGEEFTSVSAFGHGGALRSLNPADQVTGRSALVQVQVLVTEPVLNDLLQRLRSEFPGAGLRYWASPLAVEGRIE
jgi:hypothetical protein